MFRKLAADRNDARAWHDSPQAELWQRREHLVLGEALLGVTGYRCVTLGPQGLGSVETRSQTLRNWHGDVRDGPAVDFVYDGQNLPLVSGSLDVLILSHALEISSDPRRLLRESARVLSERGQIVCLVFNPSSWWSLTQGFAYRRPGYRPCATIPVAAQLADWLRLLDFETTSGWRYGLKRSMAPMRRPAGNTTTLVEPLAWTYGAFAFLARRHAMRRVPPGGRRLTAVKRPAAGLAPAAGRELTCLR